MTAERYIAIARPLQYETVFTDRTMKLALVAVWTIGIIPGMTYPFWLINADLRKCTIVPAQYELIEPAIYVPLCACLIICYGKILAISWRQRNRVAPQPSNATTATRSSVKTTTVTSGKQNNKASTSENTKSSNDMSLSGSGMCSEPALTSSAASAELEQQRQKIKSRRREYKAVYLTAAIVGTFVILWFPHMLGRVLETINYDPVITSYISRAGGAIGLANFAFAWAIYAAVSKSYRRAYRQMLIRIGCCCCKNVTLPDDNSLIA